MNREHIKTAIKVMERVRDRNAPFTMRNWQINTTNESLGYQLVDTEDIAHACGTACCFAGWLALSPEFQQEGGSVNVIGSPSWKGEHGSAALASYLDVPWILAEDIAAMDAFRGYSDAYGKYVYEITPQDVIDKLNQLLELKE